jgi:uncharacterized protein YndB with AHSA1/START domain
MGPASASITIDAPREQVFELIADLANRPAFCDHFMSGYHLQRLESRGLGAGARFHVAARRFPMWMDSVITEIEEPYRLVERGRGGHANRMGVGTAWELVEGASSGTEVTVSFWTEPANLLDSVRGRLGAGRWYARQWKRALRRLRDLIESGEEVVPVRVAGASRV